MLVSAADVDGDGCADVITSAGTGGGPRVQVFSGRTSGVLQNFFAYGDELRDGVRAYAYDPDGDGTPDLVTVEGTGQSGQMKAFNATTLAELSAPGFAGLPVGAASSSGTDSVAPSVAVITTATSPTRSAPITFTATFSEAVTGFAASGVSVENGTVGTVTAVDTTTFTFEVTPTGDGAVTVSVLAGAATDAAGNANTASTAVAVDYDTTAPVVTASPLATTSGTPTLSGTVDDSGATVSVAVGGQTVAATVSGTTWTAALPSALADGTYDIAVTATDAAGNTGSATSTGGLVIDATAPTAALTSAAPDPATTNPISVTVTFSEAVTGFDVSDLMTTNASVTNFVAVDAQTYTFDLVPAGDGTVSVLVVGGAAADAAGNISLTSPALTRTYTGPVTTAAITTSTTSPTNAATAPVTVTFSGDVTGFDASDVVVTNGTVANFTAAGGGVYTFDVAPTADGPVTVSVPAGAASDATGAPTAAAASLAITFDHTAPSVSANPLTATTGTPTLTGSVDDPAATVTVTVGGFTITATVSGTTWTAALPSALADGTYDITVTATDAAGNPASATSAGGLVIDTTAPAAALASIEPDTTAANPIAVTVTFSESVVGFDASDLAVTNGTVINFAAVDGTTYTFDVVPAGGGVVTVSVPAAAVHDPAGNPNPASDVLSRTFAGSVATAALSTPASNPSNADAIPVTVTFSDDVTGFDATDLSVTNGTVTNFVSVDARTYTADVAPAGDGAVAVSIAAGAAVDGAGGPTAAVAAITVTSDRTAPTAVVTTAGSTNTVPVTFTITFSEDISGFDETGIVVANGTLDTLSPVDGRTFTATVTPAGDGTVTLTVLAGSAADAAGNAVAVDVSGSAAFDTTGPTAVVSSAATDPTTSSPIVFVVTFSENVTGFDASDLTVTNGTASGFTALNGSTYSFSVTPTATGAVTVSVMAGVTTDAVGNPNTAADPVSRTFEAAATTDASGMTATMPDAAAAEWQPHADGLKIWDVQTGTGAAVTASSSVEVYYSGWLASDGTEFDSNRTDSTPVSFDLANLIAGWQEGLVGMQPGGIRRLYVPAALGYGSGGAGSIPANADLVFEIKLISTT
ncbi:FKBP-type peptidyl-prolyl cis-trans isomerase [bacterium]|nr:FKBP-type peptidyl-prolyl cis-trans isomerase [bacterium]